MLAARALAPSEEALDAPLRRPTSRSASGAASRRSGTYLHGTPTLGPVEPHDATHAAEASFLSDYQDSLCAECSRPTSAPEPVETLPGCHEG